VPNPESALNEEAGKLLLEAYDDYCARARLYTEIHARVDSKTGESSSSSSSNSAGVKASSTEASSDSAPAPPAKKKDKSAKDKKRTLKRL
jgi:ubiquitin-conjugating enzyme E2 S